MRASRSEAKQSRLEIASASAKDHGRTPRDDEAVHLPDSYGADLVVLQIRDPGWLHAYWELTEPTLSRGRAQLGDEAQTAARILRAHEEDSGRSFDIELAYDSQDWHLQVAPAHRRWHVEIGLLGRGGRFIPLARSNIVQTPPDRPSDRIDPEWGWLSSLPAGWPGPSSRS